MTLFSTRKSGRDGLVSTKYEQKCAAYICVLKSFFSSLFFLSQLDFRNMHKALRGNEGFEHFKLYERYSLDSQQHLFMYSLD